MVNFFFTIFSVLKMHKIHQSCKTLRLNKQGQHTLHHKKYLSTSKPIELKLLLLFFSFSSTAHIQKFRGWKEIETYSGFSNYQTSSRQTIKNYCFLL